MLSLLPALLVAGWLLAGLPLLLLGVYAPLPAVLLGGAMIALLCMIALRRLPDSLDASAWQVGGVVAVAAGSGVFNALFHSEQLIVRRDPATYAQYAVWIAEHGSLPIPRQEAAFGGAEAVLRFDSVGTFDWQGAVVPQFMPGPPLLFAAGDWLGGLLVAPAVLGALAVLTVGGATARLAGARWATVAALAFAVSLPILYTSRTTFSEIPSLILLFGGVSLIHDALARLRDPHARVAAAGPLVAGLAGLVFGLAVLVRIDGLRDVLPVLAFAGVLVALRRFGRVEGRAGVPLLAGLVVGGGLGFVAAGLLAAPYLKYLSGSVRPLLLICAAVLALTLAGTALAPPLARLRLPRRLPEIGAGLVVLVMVGLAVRPWVQDVTRAPVTPDDVRTYEFIRQVERSNGLPLDGTRLYFEDSLYWVIWYVGLPVVILATVAAALLVRRMLRGGELGWLLPLAMIGWTTVTTLLRPEITPDQPWASRRLVPLVIPGLIMLAAWFLGWLHDKTRRLRYGPRLQTALAALGTVLILIPPAITSIGTAFTPIERGESAAVEAMCEKIPPNASVLIVERVTGDRFTQVVRGMCATPTAQVRHDEGANTPAEVDVDRLISKIRETGRIPVLLAAESSQLTPYGTPDHILALVTRQDERSLTTPPDGTWTLKANVWMTIPD